MPPKLLACTGFLYKVVHKIGRLRKLNRSRENTHCTLSSLHHREYPLHIVIISLSLHYITLHHFITLHCTLSSLSREYHCTLSSLHHRVNLARNVMGVRYGSLTEGDGKEHLKLSNSPTSVCRSSWPWFCMICPVGCLNVAGVLDSWRRMATAGYLFYFFCRRSNRPLVWGTWHAKPA